MKYLFITLSAALLSLSTFGQDRPVTWVGGLGDDGEFWQGSAQEFATSRRTAPSNIDYVTGLGVNVMADQIPARGANAIGIGQSMGGVALRDIDERDARNRIGGIITLGSPMNGGRVLNADRRGEVNAYIDHGIREISKGPHRSLLTQVVVVYYNGLSRGLTGRGAIEILRELVLRVSGAFGGISKAELEENSQYMRGARLFRPNVPRISISGNESSPVHFRLAQTALETSLLESSRIERVGINVLSTILDKAEGVYNVQYIRNLVPPTPLRLWRAAGWKAGRDYWRNESEKGWNSVIGAVRTESSQSCYEVEVCGDDYSCYDNIETYEDYLACQELCYEQRCRTITTTFNQPSDGLFHQSTQRGERTRGVESNWNPNAVYDVLQVNHAEYDDHENARERFNRIFDGRDGAPPFFITRRR